MKKRILTKESITSFQIYLKNEEKSKNTIEKYIRDVSFFAQSVGASEITKEVVITYKEKLILSKYATRSINSMLASLNSMFVFLGWDDCKVKYIKVQRQMFYPKEKELTKGEYERLVTEAKRLGNDRLHLILLTICGTGIRVSELQYITVEAVKTGVAKVLLKGKNRTIFIVNALKKKLLNYAKKQNILSGPIFITANGNAVNRSNIWREMKKLCGYADVDPQKVFPHNLRHLFARSFYGVQKDIAKLADVLGHSSIDTTRIYIATTIEEHCRCIEKLRLII